MNNLDGARYLVWCDLETTGISPLDDHIIEVAVVVTDLDLETLGDYQEVIRIPGWAGNTETWKDKVHPNVLRMHEENGLWREVSRSTVSIEQADLEITTRLRVVGQPHEFALAGSGVAHFDRNFIDHKMPHFARMLRYWSVDVGVMRRVLKLSGRDDLIVPQERKNHRAMDDVRMHIRELQLVREGLRK